MSQFLRRALFALGALSCSTGDPAHSNASSVAATSSGGDSSGRPVGSGGARAMGVGASSTSFPGGSTALGGSSGSLPAIGGGSAAGGSPAGRAAGDAQTSGGSVSDGGHTTPFADGAAPPSDASSGGAACDVTILLYPDCDGDGYAAQGARLEPVCVVGTAPPPSECRNGIGSWTTWAPTNGAIDCDDGEGLKSPGNTDDCNHPDGIDNDCDGIIDAHWYYADCDGDGYAPAAAASQRVLGCDPPPPCGGSGAYVLTAPTGNAVDCDDADAMVHQGSSYQTTADPKWGFDFDCDGNVTPEISLTGVSSFAICVNATRRCVGDTGWVGATAPACGDSAVLSECRCFDGFCSLCQRVTATAVQACR